MAEHFKDLVFRPRAEPGSAVPLGARSVGHYIVHPGFWELPKPKHFTQLFWSIAGTGALMMDDEEQLLPPQHVGVYLPGMVHDIRVRDERWEYRFVTVDGPLAPGIAGSFGLSAGVFKSGPAPVGLFERLRAAMLDISHQGELRASILAYEVLAWAASGLRPAEGDERIRSGVELIHREWNDSTLNVSRVARELQMHRSVFSRRFRRAMGVAPCEYISRLRIQNALSLLNTTSMPIYEIARRCGYEDPNYFSRLMRRSFGQPPRHFRQGLSGAG